MVAFFLFQLFLWWLQKLAMTVKFLYIKIQIVRPLQVVQLTSLLFQRFAHLCEKKGIEVLTRNFFPHIRSQFY